MSLPRTILPPSALQALVPPRHPTREDWLAAGMEMLGVLFEDLGYPVPKMRVSCSWPGGGSPHKRIGECWPRSYSADGVNEIFISPVIDNPIRALDVLTHEICHALDDCKSKHGGAFVRAARAIGLEGKPTATIAGAELAEMLGLVVAELGPYPHSRMRLVQKAKKPRSTVKCACPDCGIRFNIASKFTVAHKLVCPAEGCGADLDLS